MKTKFKEFTYKIPKMEFNKFRKIDGYLSTVAFNDSKDLINHFYKFYLESQYKPQLDILYSYYLYLISKDDLKFISRPDLSLKNYKDYPLEYFFHYLMFEKLNHLIDKREDVNFVEKSFSELITVKALTEDDDINHKIVEDWILSVPMKPDSITRQHIRLVQCIYGKRLQRYLNDYKNN
jgi:hypothetical protein